MLKILFADDSMTAQNMGKKILTDAGYEVIAVSNGAAAAKKLLEHQPDVAILDVHMPGYSGFEVCAKIRAVPAIAKMPVLLTVGKMEPYSVEEGARVKADGVIIKPFEASVLLATVRNLCERAQANRAGQEEFEATMRIEPPKFEEFKDDSYNTWKSETQDAEAAERVAAEQHKAKAAIGISPEAAAAPAYAFDQTIPMHPVSDPAFAETLPFHTVSRPSPASPLATEPPLTHPSAEPVHAFEETLPNHPSLQPAAQIVPVTQEEQVTPLAPSFDETVPAWPTANQAVVQAAAHAAFLTEEFPAYDHSAVEEHIDTARIEPALHVAAEEALHDTQKIVPVSVPAQEPAPGFETFEEFTAPANVEPPAGFEPTILAPSPDAIIAREPSLEMSLHEIGLPEVSAGGEPGLQGNAVEEPTAQGFSTAAFFEASAGELKAPDQHVRAPEPTFARPQDIAFDKMVSDLLEREPVPLISSSGEPSTLSTISTASIPIPEQPAGFFSKYLALGRADEEHPAGAAPTVEITQEFGTQVPASIGEAPLLQEEVTAPPAAAAPVVSHTAHEPLESNVHESLESDSMVSGVDLAAALPEVHERAPTLDAGFYAPTMEYSYPEDSLYHDQEETMESGLSSTAASSAVADPELAAQLAAAFGHIESASQATEEVAAGLSPAHETATAAPASPTLLDVETVSLIITRVLDRVMPEIVRMIVSEFEAEKSYRLQ